jgi:tripartite-type tricarboxylate transporter receptor subunit TctC
MKFAIGLISILFAANSLAWQPTKPITVYIGYGPGSGNEIAFRGVAAEIEKNQPGVSFVIQNMPGASEAISVNHSSRLPPDGLSINVTSTLATYVSNEVFAPETLQYRSIDDLYPVMGLASSPMAIVARTTSQVNTVSDLVRYLNSTQDAVSVGMGGLVPNILYGMIMSGAQGNTNRVKAVIYKGPAQALIDVAGGHIEFAILPIAVAAPLVQSNKVKLVGLSGRSRLAQFPNTQLVQDVLPGVYLSATWNITLPRSTPQDVVDWYVDTLGRAVRSAGVQRYFQDNYIVPSTNLDPASQGRVIAELRAKYLPVSRKIKKEISE